MQTKSIFRLSVLTSALVMAGAVHGLGLGKLTLQSSLGQPLSAQIELTSATKEELDTLSVRVADPTLYRQNNLAYAPVLTRARVSVERDAGGRTYLMVTTPGNVNEPYLDLMVELSWASGRVVREYTFLLDPPGVGVPAAAVEPATPVRQGRLAPRAAPAQAPATAPSPTGAPSGPGGGQYTVQRGDTLTRIAAETKPASVTLEQMLVALFKTNQSAFDGDNINRLRSGAILTIPSADEALATPATEAARIVRMQATDWRGYRDRVAAAAPEVQEAPSRAATGRIGTAVEEKTPATIPGRDQLRVSREAGLPGKAAVAEESAAAAQALKDAQTRIAELERTLKSLQQAIELRNQTLAQLQTQAEVATGKGAPVPPPGPAAVAPEPVKVEPTRVEAAPIEAPKPEAPKAEPPTAEAPKTPEAPKIEAAKPPEPPKIEAPPAKAMKAELPKAAVPPPKAAEPSFVEEVLGSVSPWAIGGGALVVLGGIAAFVVARRHKTAKFEDSIISPTDVKTDTVFASSGGGVVNTGESSLATDFSREGLSNIDTDEVDPIAEAEVYLAYGRDAQAEEILKEALKKDPARQEIYLKLLEIHAQHNKPAAFETVAAELFSVSQGKGDVWQKAVVLGRQLDPTNPLFADSGATAAAAAVASAAVAAAAMPRPEPTSPPGAAPPAAPARAAAGREGDSGIDFQLEDDFKIVPAAGAKPKAPLGVAAPMEGAAAEAPQAPGPAAKTGAEERAEAVKASVAGTTAATVAGAAGLGQFGIEKVEPIVDKIAAAEANFDLDFHLDEDEKPAPIRASTKAAAPFEHAPAIEGKSSSSRAPAAIDLDKLDLSFDPDKATFEDPTPSVLDGQWHDAATKLDLARAYQEMGDVEGAREILHEVMREGDEQQKSEAQTLMSKLG